MAERYRTIVADPPWPYPDGFGERIDAPHKQDRERGVIGTKIGRRQLPYQAMTLEEIAQLPIRSWADENCRLFLWTTNRYLTSALSTLGYWGFAYKQLLIWDKTPTFNPLSGSVAAVAAEFLVCATQGKPARLSVWPTSVVRARKARATHSRKPDVFLDLVEQVSPGPYLELFARRARFGWDYWGDESLGTAEMANVG